LSVSTLQIPAFAKGHVCLELVDFSNSRLALGYAEAIALVEENLDLIMYEFRHAK
jgi:hypothetical protein